MTLSERCPCCGAKAQAITMAAEQINRCEPGDWQFISTAGSEWRARELLVTLGRQLHAIEREGWMGGAQTGLLASMILTVDTFLASGEGT